MAEVRHGEPGGVAHGDHAASAEGTDVPGQDRADHGAPRATWYRNDRVIYRIVAVLTVAPILIAAVRDARNGWVPAGDAAHTVLRARFALSFHPGLVGIYTDASNWINTPTYFPGPWWLWWMSIPIRVLGTTWGSLLPIAILNALWILLAGWCVKRRLGYRAAMGALVTLGALTWSLGTAAYHSPVGQVMIVPTFAAFCFIAWALAAGDEGVLPALALITNFILLDEVVLVRLVPVITVAALVIWAAGVVSTRREHADRWPELRRRTLRSVAGAAAVTIVMWIPPLYQELTHNPGNLTNLWRAARAAPPTTPVWGQSYGVLVSFFAKPPFWFHGSRSSNHLLYDPPPAVAVQVIVGILLVALFAGLGVVAARRRDRAALSALILGAVVFAAAWYNVAHPSNPTGLPTYVGYFLSTWAVAMFVTFALVYGLVRALRGRLPRAHSMVAVAVAGFLAVVNLPYANLATGTYASTDRMIEAARSLDPAVVSAVRGHRVALAPQIGQSDVGALAVALNDAGIPFCINNIPQWTGLPVPQCAAGFADVTVEFTQAGTTSAPKPEATVIARYDPLTVDEHRELRALTQRVRTAADAASNLQPTDEYASILRVLLPAGPTRESLLNPSFLVDPGATMRSASSRAQFASLLSGVNAAPGHQGAMLTHLPGVPDDVLVRWARLETRYDFGSFVVTMTRNR